MFTIPGQRSRRAISTVLVFVALGGCGSHDEPTNRAGAVSATPNTASTMVDPSPDGQTPPAANEASPPSITYAGQPTSTTRPEPSPSTSAATTSIPPQPVPLPTDALFGTNRCDVAAHELDGLTAELRPFVTSLDANDRLVAEAWTDDRGDETGNIALSLCRAEFVVELLADNWPMLEGRVDAVGHGESDPPTKCSGDCPANRVVVVRVAAGSS